MASKNGIVSRIGIHSDNPPELWSYVGGIARTNRMTALAIGGTSNHIHILLSLPATIPSPRQCSLIKGGSSKWLHEKTGRRFHMASRTGVYGECFAFESNDWYINSQAEHHATRIVFEDAISDFLQRHGIALSTDQYVLG